jgi:hypothetical protein
MNNLNAVIKYIETTTEPQTAKVLRSKIEGSEILKDYIIEQLFIDKIIRHNRTE